MLINIRRGFVDIINVTSVIQPETEEEVEVEEEEEEEEEECALSEMSFGIIKNMNYYLITSFILLNNGLSFKTNPFDNVNNIHLQPSIENTMINNNNSNLVYTDLHNDKTITCLSDNPIVHTSVGIYCGLREIVHWPNGPASMVDVYYEVLGLKKHHHMEWISIETVDKIKERKNKKAAIKNNRTRAEKVQAQAEYIEANKQVKKSIRADKKKYVEELAKMAEKAAREGNLKQLYDTTKKLTGKYGKPERPVKDKEGRPITEFKQQQNRWVEYFEELLNRPAPMNPPDIEAVHTDLPIDANSPTTEEIRMAGIRYAQSPTGSLRFKKPVEPIPEPKKIFMADKLPSTCPQPKDTMFQNSAAARMWVPNTPMSEDCLFLNIWVPLKESNSSHSNSKEKLAVMPIVSFTLNLLYNEAPDRYAPHELFDLFEGRDTPRVPKPKQEVFLG
ncbi:unnamed protein product [Schistosoma margrebowiei]|uniref:Uncharacterized protein n=1 Tax=Schistosoma margrebowiei TaxID=48269 RepID=A0A183MJX4_9TREM|nr:unnamed protein product [Schistosoma margrebowiei]